MVEDANPIRQMIDWRAFRRENPDIHIHDPLLLGEGWNCLGYRLNSDLVAKVLKTDEWEDLANEIAFLTPVVLVTSEQPSLSRDPLGQAA